MVATHHTAELRFYDARGRYIRTAGRMGSGPGEFRDIGGDLVRAPGDTLIAGLSSEPVWFSPEGRFLRQGRIDRVVIRRQFIPANHISSGMDALPDGSVLLSYTCNVIECVRPENHIFRMPKQFVRILPNGSRADGIASTLGHEDVDPEFFRQNPGIFMRPFMRKDHVAFGGNPLIIYIGESGSNGIASYRVDNGERANFTIDIEPSRVTPEDMESWISNYSTDRRPRQRLERSLLLVPAPKTHPLYKRLAVDVDGNLWVEHALPVTEDVTRWSVYSRTGDLLTEVSVPARVRAVDIGKDYLLAAWEDENDVPFIYMYQLKRGGNAIPN